MRRRGYKVNRVNLGPCNLQLTSRMNKQAGIHLGLTLYSLGIINQLRCKNLLINVSRCCILLAISKICKIRRFCRVHLCHRWKINKTWFTYNFWSFVFVFFPGCGLATLEVAANSYISVLGTPKYAAARLNFSQGFQGLATFAGPQIASRWFFLGANATKLDTVQWYVQFFCSD